MAKSLLIVESPAKVQTLKKIVGKDFIIKASVGHIKDLPKKKLGVDVDNDFAPSYITIRGKGKVLGDLKKAAKQADNIYLAPDPDREGEAIAHHIEEEVVKCSKGKIYRVSFNEITKKAVNYAISHPTELNVNRVNAQQARRILDRLVGYKISPLLWKKVQRGLSAGRVQSVALRIVCDREKEIQAFKPEEYWSITAQLEGPVAPAFEAKLAQVDEEKAEIHNQNEADAILKKIEGKEFVLKKITRKERKRNPLPPFITSTLQQEASSKLGFSPKKTMMLAQRLYEGVPLGDKGTVGLITYMRTDSTRLSDEALMQVRDYIPTRYGGEYLPGAANFYKSKKSAQEAHEAIRTTDVSLDPQFVKPFLERDLFRLYELIWSRFVACQMVPAIFEATQFYIYSETCLFRANGSVLKFPGFLIGYKENPDDKLLPSLEEDNILKLLKITPEQHFTQPPPRYSEAALVKTLEEKGVGRPSTYAPIISVIKDREYVKNEEKKLVPTELGVLVTDLLVENFPDILTTEFTANMETKLDLVEEGKTEWVDALKEFYVPFEKDLKEAEQKMRNVKAEVEETDEMCPKCSKPMVIKRGRFGKFMACTGYPDCKTTRQLSRESGDGQPAVTEEVDGKCDQCDSPLVVKMGRFGKFIACSTYPDCKFTKPISLGVDCPESGCGGYISQRRSKKGRTFYGCSKYPDCKFTSWDKPVAESCPECRAPYLVEKWKKDQGKSIICVREGCGFKRTGEAA
ncbi:MAG: type I DNA topoisomerase [Nitrospinales bacterium]